MKVVGKQCSWNMGIGISLGLHHVTALSSTRQLQAINLYHYPIYGNTTQLSNTTGFQLKFAQPVAGLKRELVRGGGRCTARCWKMEKGFVEIKIG